MRKHSVLFGLLVGSLLSAEPCAAQEKPRTIIEAALKAHGGAEKLARVKASQMKGKGTIHVLGGIAFSAEGYSQLPDKVKSVLSFEINGMKFSQVQILNGDKASITMNGQDVPIDDKMKAEMKEQLYAERVESLYVLLESGFTLSAAGESMVAGKPALGVKVVSAGHRDVTLYFDKASNMLVKSQSLVYDPMSMKDVQREKLYSDYREQDGIKSPMKLLTIQDGNKFLEIDVTEYKILDKLDDSIFKP